MAKFKTVKQAFENGYKIYCFGYNESFKEWHFHMVKEERENGVLIVNNDTYVDFWIKSFPKYIDDTYIKK